MVLMDKKTSIKHQAVFIAAIIGFMMIVVFFLALPMLNSMISVAKSQNSSPFERLLMDGIVFFIFIIIMFVIIKLARSD